MRRIVIYLSIFLIVSCSTSKNATTDHSAMDSVATIGTLDRTNPPAPGPAPEIQLGDHESFQLENGLKVYIVKNDKLPRVSFSLQIDRDPILEADKAGYVSIFGDLWSRGTESRSKAEIDEAVDFVGASVGTTSTGMFGSSLTRHKETVLEIMKDILLHPTFPQEELDKLKKLSLSDLASSKDDPSSIALNIRNLVIYGVDHPYGELISEASINNISREDCLEYFRKYWSPKKAYLAIIGDISSEEARQLAESYFGEWTGDEIPEHQYDQPSAPEKTDVAFVDRPASVQSEIRVAYALDLKPSDERYFASRILTNILGGGISSRLMQNLREDKGYTYDARSSLSPDQFVGKFTANTFCRNEVTDSAVAEILFEMRDIVENGITEDELKASKAYLTGSFARTLEQPRTIARFAINTSVLNLPKDFYHTYLKELNAVTLEEVNAAAKMYIKPDNAHIVVVGKAGEVADKLERFGKITYYDTEGNIYDPGSMNKALLGRSAESILESYMDAIGGKEQLQRVASQKQVWEMSAYGQIMKIESLMVSDGKFRVDVIMGDKVRQSIICDGNDVATLAGTSVMQMDDETKESEMLNNRLFPELYYSKSNVKLQLDGVEKIDGSDAYAIKVVYPSGKESSVYFDVKSGLKVKESTTIDTPNGSYPQSVTYSDYNVFEGVLYPYTSTTQAGSQEVKSTLVQLENNLGIDPAVFTLEK